MFCKVVEFHSKCKYYNSNGCTFPSNSCEEIIPICNGCANIILYNKKMYCKIHPSPKNIWAIGKCKLATNR